MENLKAFGTLDEDGIVFKLGQAQNPSEKTLKVETGLSSSSVPSGVVLIGENGGGFEAKSCMGVNNVEVWKPGIDIEKGFEGSAEEEVVVVKNAMEEGMEEGSASLLSEVDPARKIEVSGNGISLFVEVFGPPNGFIQRNEAVFGENVLKGGSSNHLYGGNGALLSDIGENLSADVSESHDLKLGVMQNSTIDGEAKGGSELWEDATYDRQCKLSVGDLVWVKTKVQSWWPGLILDPSYAPKDAVKSDKRECLLVKYFGHGSYVWCSPLQLKPFIDNFEQMSAQSDSVNFYGAVKKAVDEFGQRVKLQMTCSCILKENQTVLTAPLAGNGGSLERNLVPENKECKIGENFVTQFEPANFLAFLKYLAQDVSMPGMLEFATTQNRLSAYLRAIGHRQLPMLQLRGTTDAKDGGAEDGIAPEKCKSDFSEEGIRSSSRNKEGNKDSEVRNGGVDIRKLASSAEEMTKLSISPTTRKNKVSTTENGGSGGKSEKGYETRERRRSKYLSPPYINLSGGQKNSPISDDNETEHGKGDSHVGPGTNPPIVKSSTKKLQKKSSRKAISGHKTSRIPRGTNVSSVDMLYELCFAALDCHYPNQNRDFNSVERFISCFRSSVFHDESNHEMDGKNKLGEVTRDEAKGMVEESTEPGGTKPFSDTPDTNNNDDYSGSVGNDTQERSHLLPNVTSKRRTRKKKIETAVSNAKPTAVFSDVNANPTSGSFMINFQQTGCVAPDDTSVPKKRKKAGKIPELLQANLMVGLPDLNENCATPSSLVKDSQATNLTTCVDKLEPKKRKRGEGDASEHAGSKIHAALTDSNVSNGNKVGLFLKDVPVMGPCSTQDIAAELNNNREGLKVAASLYPNNKLTANQPDTNGNNNAEMSSFFKDQQQSSLLFPVGNPEPKKRRRRRKEKAPVDNPKTKVSSAIPDLNGNVAEHSSQVNNLPETNSAPPDGKPQRKRRIRNKPVAWIPDFNVNNNEVQRNGEVLGTALYLKFTEGFPLPSKEVLFANFCGFGPIMESETQALNDSSIAQVIFVNGSDARNAFRSLEKSSPFGAALVNYRLCHLSAASRASEADTDLRVPVTNRTTEGLNIPAKPSGLKPHTGEAPDLAVIRKNLEMMTSMLEKAGDNLSPEMRAKLETDIKGLLKKVSTMDGSASSS